MISAATKASYLRATVQAVGSGIKPLAAPAIIKQSAPVHAKPQTLASVALNQSIPCSGNIRVTTGVPGETKISSH